MPPAAAPPPPTPPSKTYGNVWRHFGRWGSYCQEGTSCTAAYLTGLLEGYSTSWFVLKDPSAGHPTNSPLGDLCSRLMTFFYPQLQLSACLRACIHEQEGVRLTFISNSALGLQMGSAQEPEDAQGLLHHLRSCPFHFPVKSFSLLVTLPTR